MSEEYKDFNNYEDSAPEKDAPVSQESTAAETQPADVPAPDPNPPTGWAPGHSEQTAPAESHASPKGIVSIILSFAGFCSYGIASLVGIFLAGSAYKRNKADVTAKIGLTACILMVILWAAYIAFLAFTPEGRDMLAELVSEVQKSMEEVMSSSDMYYYFLFK